MLAAALAAVYLVIVGALYAAQRSFLYLPDKSRPDAAASGVAGLREVTLRTEDGVPLLAWYLPRSGAPTIVYFHGNAGSIADRRDRLARLSREGFGALLPEYRGYGGNSGKPTEPGLLADARAALDFIAAEGIPAERLVLWGESLGSGVAVAMATERPVGAVVLEAPYTSLAAAAQHHYPFVPAALLLKDRFDSLARVGRVRAPILVAHGELDTVVPVRLGRALYAAAPEPKEGWFPAAAGHNDLGANGLVDTVVDFIRRRIPPR